MTLFKTHKFYLADAAAVNPNGIRRLLANSVRTFFISGKTVVVNYKSKKLSF